MKFGQAQPLTRIAEEKTGEFDQRENVGIFLPGLRVNSQIYEHFHIPKIYFLVIDKTMKYS